MTIINKQLQNIWIVQKLMNKNINGFVKKWIYSKIWKIVIVQLITLSDIANYLKGVAYSETDDFKVALDMFNELAKSNPQFYPTFYDIDDCQIYFFQEICYLKCAIIRKPQQTQHKVQSLILILLWDILKEGIRFFFLEKYEDVIKDYTQCIKLNSEGKVYFALEKKEQAILDYTEALTIDPQYIEAYILRGNIYLQFNQNLEAIADFSQVIEIDEEYFIAYYNQGMAHQAISDYSKSIELNPECDQDYFYNRGVAYFHLKKFEEAILDLTQAIELYPEFTEAFNYRGLAFSSLGMHAEAIEDYTWAIQFNPLYLNAYKNRADALLVLGRVEEAQLDYSQSHESNAKVEQQNEQDKEVVQKEEKSSTQTNHLKVPQTQVKNQVFGLENLGKALADYKQAMENNLKLDHFGNK